MNLPGRLSLLLVVSNLFSGCQAPLSEADYFLQKGETPAAPRITELTLDRSALSLFVDAPLVTLKVTQVPTDTTADQVTWVSSNPQAMTVDAQGTVTPVAPGEGVITAKIAGVASAFCPVSVYGRVLTLAGSAATSGSADGAGALARFLNPWGLCVDSEGTLYVADTGNHTLRKVSIEGVVTTWVGSAGISGTSDGTGSAARFCHPMGLSIDSEGTVYVADQGNHAIRKVSPDGVVTTLAGLPGTLGSDDGIGSTARFSSPTGVLALGSGTLLITDGGNHTLRSWSADSGVSTLAGVAGSLGWSNGTGTAARFCYPYALASDGADGAVIADLGNNMVRVWTPGGGVSLLAGTLLGGSADGWASVASFGALGGVARHATGVLFVSDQTNGTIRRISVDLRVTTLAGLAGSSGTTDGALSQARFSNPRGLALDSLGNLFVCDNQAIRKIFLRRNL